MQQDLDEVMHVGSHRRVSIGVRLALLVVLAAATVFAVRFVRSGMGAQVFATKVGETRTVELSDSTRVTLAPLSELRVKGNYGSSHRGVDLTGEAWFEAKHDSVLAFQVRASGTVTETLGTSFSVRALSGDSVISVVVAAGSVSVGLANAPVSQGAILNAGDNVQLEARTFQAHILRGVDVEAMGAWRNGRLDFRGGWLADVAAELPRWYGITMRFETPELAHTPVSYSIPTNDLAKTIEVIGASLAVHVERKGDTLIVR